MWLYREDQLLKKKKKKIGVKDENTLSTSCA